MPHAAYRQFIQQRRDNERLRALRAALPLPGGRVRIDGRELVNFSSNDYLGLAEHPELIARAQAWTRQYGAGSRASRLVCGNLEPFAGIEEKLARGKGSAAALIFNSGYQANVAILSALLDAQVIGKRPLVFSDRLNHASIHHGCHAAGVRQLRYQHGDLNHLETLLLKHRSEPGPRFILSETVFSMDGDSADVAGLIALKERYGAFLYLDEAHATGVLGPDGFGLSAAFPGQVELAMGTFSKGLGSFGAYAAGAREMIDYLINNAGGLIYATALPPAVLGAIDAALDLLPTLEPAREALHAAATRLRASFQSVGLDTGLSTTQIVPLIVGPEAQALELSRLLESSGLLAVAIRPPTVPVGASRIRFTLSAAHSEAALLALQGMAGTIADALRRGFT
ncbi:MAG: 8-amino-7-oxononanoate synthase [Magnetococcales bacterium]|nr:8-amino-7-oxononanoate synthase [Magnetococcales bacterium]